MVDQDKIKEAVKLLLEGIGEDTGREGLLETPDRIARMYGHYFLFRLRASSDAFLWKGAYCVSAGWQSGGPQ